MQHYKGAMSLLVQHSLRIAALIYQFDHSHNIHGVIKVQQPHLQSVFNWGQEAYCVLFCKSIDLNDISDPVAATCRSVLSLHSCAFSGAE